jgi:hypothetical protein
VWGRWGLENHSGQPVLGLSITGAAPPIFLNQFGPGPVVERHAVMNVQANQIQLFDALMVRQYVMPGRAMVTPMPIAPPTPAYSAPAPLPVPAPHATPVLNQFRSANAEVSRQIADIQANIPANNTAITNSIADKEAAFQQDQLDGAKKLADLTQKGIDDSTSRFILAMHGIYTVTAS